MRYKMHGKNLFRAFFYTIFLISLTKLQTPIKPDVYNIQPLTGPPAYCPE